jgi:hypothetical protein
MRKKGTIFPIFQSLPREIQRANENRYSARKGLSSITEETCDTINRFPEIIQSDQFDIEAVIFSEDRKFGVEPSTPPYQNSDSEDEIPSSEELVSNSSTRVEGSSSYFKNTELGVEASSPPS